jgi:hypothetical protein
VAAAQVLNVPVKIAKVRPEIEMPRGQEIVLYWAGVAI